MLSESLSCFRCQGDRKEHRDAIPALGEATFIEHSLCGRLHKMYTYNTFNPVTSPVSERLEESLLHNVKLRLLPKT